MARSKVEEFAIDDDIPIPTADVGKGGRVTHESSHYPEAKLIIEKYFTEWFYSNNFKDISYKAFAKKLHDEHGCYMSIDVIKRYMRKIKKKLMQEKTG